MLFNLFFQNTYNVGYAQCVCMLVNICEYIFSPSKRVDKCNNSQNMVGSVVRIGERKSTLRRGNIVNNEGLLSCDYCELKTKPNTPPKRLEI